MRMDDVGRRHEVEQKGYERTEGVVGSDLGESAQEDKAGMVDAHIRQDLLSEEYLRTLRQAQGARTNGFAQLHRVSKDATPVRTDLLSDGRHVRMQQTFDRMHDQEFPDGNALLDLAAKISYCTTEEAGKIIRQCNVPKSSLVELAIGAQRNMFDAYMSCVRLRRRWDVPGGSRARERGNSTK